MALFFMNKLVMLFTTALFQFCQFNRELYIILYYSQLYIKNNIYIVPLEGKGAMSDFFCNQGYRLKTSLMMHSMNGQKDYVYI